MVAARHAVLTGAPGAGKTTLVDAAAETGLSTSPEVARRLLREPGGMTLREDDPLAFAEAMLAAHMVEYENAARSGPGTVLFDRGFPDVAGFLDVSGLPVPPSVDKVCRALRYHGPVFRAPAWAAIYSPDEERIQDWAEAVASDEAVTSAWRKYGYDPIDLPLSSVADRLAFIRARLAGWNQRTGAARPSSPTAC